MCEQAASQETPRLGWTEVMIRGLEFWGHGSTTQSIRFGLIIPNLGLCSELSPGQIEAEVLRNSQAAAASPSFG